MPVSRRTFLAQAAAIPVAASLDSHALMRKPLHVAVVGAGAFGGWTALHLARRGAKVTLVDAWGPGNARASSGGESRVIRAVYGPDRVYVEMVKRSYDQWESLQSLSRERLYVETGALWLHRGDDGYVRSSLPILTELGFSLEPVPIAEAKQRYPQIDFKGVQSTWLERRAGAMFARRACLAVRDAFVEAGGSYRTAHVDPGALSNGSMGPLRLADGSQLQADAYVFACGPWLGRIFPELSAAIRPTKQEVLFFGTPRGSSRYQAGQLPVWIDFGERIFYGIPDIDGRGFKIADDTRGEDFDPTTGERTPSKESIERARRFLGERFPELAKAPLLEARVCQYENSPDGHLILDRHPAASNVWLAGGGSGHGFKLSPAAGELMAAAVLEGAAIPATFLLSRLNDKPRRSTQFEQR